MSATETSYVDRMLASIADASDSPDDAHALLDEVLDAFDDGEIMRLRYDWPIFARPKQMLDPDAPWSSVWFVGGRGFGKTRPIAEYLVGRVFAGEAKAIALMAQNEENVWQFMIEGPSGLVACSPPWFPVRVFHGVVTWPNSALAYIYTPEAPGVSRGHEHDHAWLSEIIAWPRATADEALANIEFSTRQGAARILGDTTPRRRHPALRQVFADHASDPLRYDLRQGSLYENRTNLTQASIDRVERKYAGTQRGREEIEGIFSDDDQGALWRQEWIDDHRRDLPRDLRRRVWAVDPAISTRAGTDTTGLIECAEAVDGQYLVLDDLSGAHTWEAWGDLVLDGYERGRCDCVVVERNRGGDAVVANLRARGVSEDRVAAGRKLRVVVVDAKARTRWVPGVVHVKEVIGRRGKAERAGPVASLYEAGRVSHVRGADLSELEDLLCTWVPDPRQDSPDRLDALCWGISELAGLHPGAKRPGGGGDGMRGVEALAARQAPPKPINVAALVGRSGRGGRL